MKTWQDKFSEYLSIRDRFDLKKRDLLADYAEISKRRPNAAFATAIRNQSMEYLDILSMEASGNRLVWDELRALAAYTYSSAGVSGLSDRLFGKTRSDTFSTKPIEDIARLILLSCADERDRRVGAWLLSAVNQARPADRKIKRLGSSKFNTHCWKGRRSMPPIFWRSGRIFVFTSIPTWKPSSFLHSEPTPPSQFLIPRWTNG